MFSAHFSKTPLLLCFKSQYSKNCICGDPALVMHLVRFKNQLKSRLKKKYRIQIGNAISPIREAHIFAIAVSCSRM